MIYYKTLAHMIMETDKSQNLQSESAGWRSRRIEGLNTRTNGVVGVQMLESLTTVGASGSVEFQKAGKSQSGCPDVRESDKRNNVFFRSD